LSRDQVGGFAGSGGRRYRVKLLSRMAALRFQRGWFAERDGVIDDNEIGVLKKIIAHIKPEELDQTMRDKLA
jgi:hypothetical protein